MVKQGQVRLIPWKDLSIILVIHNEVLFQEAWKRYLNLFKCNPAKTQLSWSELAIYKFTMKSSQICLRLKELLYRSEKIRKKGFSLKV